MRLLSTFRAVLAAGAVAGLLGIGGAAPVAATADGRWIAGDLHVHTTYSHDSWHPVGDDNTDPTEDPEDVIVLGWSVGEQALIAKSRGLDFLAITDHNDVRAQTDDGWALGQSLGLTMVPAYENSLRGHAQMLGATSCLEPLPVAGKVTRCSGPNDTPSVLQAAGALTAAGGAFQVNHPAEGMTNRAAEDDTGSWDWSYGYDVPPASVEVWNIPWVWQPPMPSASSNDDAVRYWEGWLNRGYRVAATGGSDNHWRSTTAVQGVGQPTTWVYVTSDGPQGVIDGIRAGRTFVSHQPPAHGGPRLFLEADADGDGTFEAMVGDEIPAGAQVRVRTENAPPGARVRLVTSSGVIVPANAPAGGEVRTTIAGASWVRAELVTEDLTAERMTVCEGSFGSQTTYCRNRLAMLALTSALYVV